MSATPASDQPDQPVKAKAVITLTLDNNNALEVSLEFEPPVDNTGGPNPITHHAALEGAEAIATFLNGARS